ncbi:CAAX protease [Streptomyces rimosus subsp. rimosus]|uniref:CPBP family intramembrane metalloprotease n=2 Tax=Streptomyces rimosus subsp. rimosus TaxID=132474 RepID=A0A8A1V383_STRR1|nr:CAAX protease [Streptomyces rimosus]KOG70167.1 CAAX protease [Kitasatospora aureofaciens]KOT33922.1 CAAX protease [Streptomyces rimosus subsp. rimosus]KOT34272.1 CAAX protease [Streptomyces sp. NRRL WC-3701]MYT48311.1 CPBP family intramembrane metalloprotease [Streptomyces sp. SID5471]QGY71662.1 CPBP family intramembrane metalloprotease [Streptomyces rimosus R6-500]QST86488.1 CPBP family intramembrane metalloprotease [Streptomyces rimosus subsp. rimosus ATCC 10970]
MSTGAAVGFTVAVLVIANVVNNRWAPGFGVLTAVVFSVLLLGVLFRSGGTWADAGMGAATLKRGALWAVVLIGLVGVGYAVAALLPVTRGLFADERYGGLTGGQVALRVLVAVPVGTVLLEEIAFRGVLYGLVRRARGAVWATVVSSVLFGVWHVLPSLGLAVDKPALTPLFGRSVAGAVIAVVAAVLFTGAAGVLFCELRRRSGSLLAPMGLHWAVNAFGYLVGFLLR